MCLHNYSIWAITTYYNPANYKRKKINYVKFRQNCSIPLLAIELSFTGQFELNKDDADIVVQICCDSIMWHKERLLNVALKCLPKNIKYVTWLDCDIIFKENNWVQLIMQKLEKQPLVQVFNSFYDLQKDDLLYFSYANTSTIEPTGYSIAYLNTAANYDTSYFIPNSTFLIRKNNFGLGWAAHTDILLKHGFYDAMIIGNGDMALAFAAWGRFEDFILVMHLNKYWAAHYLEWAIPFFESVRGNVGFVNTTLFHLWHGDIKNRKYYERQKDFSFFNFNPYTDIVINNNGSWSWSTNNKKLISYVGDYFSIRNEDGLLK